MMTSIIKANENHSHLLSEIAKITFIESHGHSAKLEDINTYVAEKYNEAILKNELQNSENIYHIIYHTKSIHIRIIIIFLNLIDPRF